MNPVKKILDEEQKCIHGKTWHYGITGVITACKECHKLGCIVPYGIEK